MKSRVALWIMLASLLVSMVLVAHVQPFKTIETIYINADGTVSPSNAPIQQNGNVYTLTDNISDGALIVMTGSAIIIQKDDIVLDGAGYTLEGPGLATGIELSGRQDVTIEYLTIQGFDEGISLTGGQLNTISRTNITSNEEGIFANSSSLVSILNNNIENNELGINYSCPSTTNYGRICENYIANNSQGLQLTGVGTFYYNSFVNNTVQANSTLNIPQYGGYGAVITSYNYWSDYNGTDRGDGIGGTPYTIDANNIDLYPLMHPYGAMYDVAITDVACRTVVDQGSIDEIISQGINKAIINETAISVTAKNLGLYNETFNVTAYYSNGTLTPEMWDAFARMGDINRDGQIDNADYAIVAKYYGRRGAVPPSVNIAPPWGLVGISELVTLGKSMGALGNKTIWSYFNLSSGVIGTQQVTDLAPGGSELLNFTWNIADMEYQAYTISAYAQPSLNETETQDNMLASSAIVTIPGDINGDFICNLEDLVNLSDSYPTTPGVEPQNWNPNAAINNDGNVSLVDLVILTDNYDRQLYQHCTVGDDSDAAVNSTDWYAQTFTVGTQDETITSVKLKLYQGAPWVSGSAGDVTVSIRATDADGNPTGQDLTSGTIDGNTLNASSPGQFRDVPLTKFTLSANTTYAIVVEGPSGSANYVVWRMDSSSTYDGGSCMYSSDSGANWNVINGEFMFAVWYVFLNA